MQEAVSIRRILPDKFRLFLKISSLMYPVANKSFNQLSVSKHSFLAIFNLESISGKLCGYWASVMFAKTLDEDLRICKTVLEQSFIFDKDWHIISMSTANCSAYFISKFSFIVSSLQKITTPVVYEIRDSGMQSILYVIKSKKLHTRQAVITYAYGDYIPNLRLG